MPDNLLAANTALFQRIFPDYPVAIPTEPSDSIKLITTPSNDVSALYKGRPLHSRRSPKREAQRIVERLQCDQDNWIVVFGFGLGWHVEELCIRFTDHRIIVLDPDPAPFTAAFFVRNLHPILTHPRLTLLIGSEAPLIDAVLSDIQYQQVTIVPHTPSVELNRPFYHAAQNRIHRLLQRRQVNHNTLKRFGKLWVRNFAANIAYNVQALPIVAAADQLSSVPGLLIAAGPSFDHAVHHLPELRRHCVLAAVDTALPLCLRHGIDPDIVVAVDPQYWNTRHLDRCGSSRALVVSESSAHPRIFRTLRGPFLFGESLFPLGKLLEKPLGSRGALGAGGSVATSAFEVLKMLGCREIFTIGLDLGFPDIQTHSRGSFFEETIHSIGTRKIPAEMKLWRYLVDGGKIDSHNYAGDPIRTDARMQVYQQWFALQLETNPHIKLRPLSTQGLAIAGAQPADIAEVLQRPDVRPLIDSKLRDVRAVSEQFGNNSEPLRPHIDQLLNGLAELETIATAALQHIDTAWNHPYTWDESWQQQLKQYDTALQQHSNKDVAGFLLQEALEDIQSVQRTDHPLAGSRTLYRALCDSIRFHYQQLKRAQKQL